MEDSRDSFKPESRLSYKSGRNNWVSRRPFTAPELQRRVPTPLSSPTPVSRRKSPDYTRLHCVNSTPVSRQSAHHRKWSGSLGSRQSNLESTNSPSLQSVTSSSTSWSIRRLRMPVNVHSLTACDDLSHGALEVGTAPSRGELPPSELIAAAIRRIIEDPPPPRRTPSAEVDSAVSTRRRTRRKVPTGGNSRRYPPGLLCDSSDEGHDTDWYPQRWEDVLGSAVANLPPSHFYRSWRTNSRGVLHYLLGNKLDDEAALPLHETNSECYGGPADLYDDLAPRRYSDSRCE